MTQGLVSVGPISELRFDDRNDFLQRRKVSVVGALATQTEMASIDVSIHATVPARHLEWNGLRVREDVLDTDAKGREKSKLHTRAAEAIDDLSGVLRRVLDPTQTIFYVTTTQIMPSALVQVFSGG